MCEVCTHAGSIHGLKSVSQAAPGFFLNKGTGALRPDTPGVRHPTEMPTEPVRLGSVLTCCCTTYTISQNDLFSAKISQHHHLTMCLILK